jgi:hypothetical protein
MMRRAQDRWSPYIRFVLGGQAVITWYSTFSNPNATFHALSKSEDGGIFFWAIGICGALLMVDLFVNDWFALLPNRRQESLTLGWRRIWKSRHWLFIAIAGCFAALPLIVDAFGQSDAVKLVCYWYSVIYMAAAFIDAGERSRRLWWQRMCN